MNDFGPYMMVASLIAMAEEGGIPISRLQGTTNQSDFISHYISCNQPIRFELDGHLRILTDHVKYCTELMPKWHPISVVGQHMQQAGANPVQALAFTLATGIFYVDTFIKAGLDVDDFAPRFSFFFDISGDYFRLRIMSEILQELALVDVASVPIAYDFTKVNSSGSCCLDHIVGISATLGNKANRATLLGKVGAKGQAAGGTIYSQAIWSQYAHPSLASDVHQLSLQLLSPSVIALAKTSSE